MYTGLVQEVGVIASKSRREGVDGISVITTRKFLAGLKVGGSIALNGICLSVTKINAQGFCADVSAATALVTNFKNSNVNDQVNLERSAVAGGEIGGHLTAGHVDGTGQVTEVLPSGETMKLHITVPGEIFRYAFAKGFMAVNGASLTVAAIEVEDRTLQFNLIPETLRQTTFSSIKVGDSVNVEAEPTTRVLVDTLRRSLIR